MVGRYDPTSLQDVGLFFIYINVISLDSVIGMISDDT